LSIWRINIVIISFVSFSDNIFALTKPVNTGWRNVGMSLKISPVAQIKFNFINFYYLIAHVPPLIFNKAKQICTSYCMILQWGNMLQFRQLEFRSTLAVVISAYL